MVKEMNANFIVNDYVLIWTLLFGTSISETIYKLKQKIWKTYKNEYNEIFKDKDEILKDYKNFIPNDDTIYNIVLENIDYERIKKQTEKYRIEIMKLWDKKQKETENLVKNILRIKMPKYTVFIVSEELNVINHSQKDKLIVGKQLEKNEPLRILIDINFSIAKNHLKKYKGEYENIKKTILELTVQNEYATRLLGRSCYQTGDPKLSSIKKWLYPYWLMYLGVSKEEFFSYMMRDKIVFEVEEYIYEPELKKMDIEEFIEFCIRNQRYIIKKPKVGIKKEVEIL